MKKTAIDSWYALYEIIVTLNWPSRKLIVLFSPRKFWRKKVSYLFRLLQVFQQSNSGHYCEGLIRLFLQIVLSPTGVISICFSFWRHQKLWLRAADWLRSEQIYDLDCFVKLMLQLAFVAVSYYINLQHHLPCSPCSIGSISLLFAPDS